jgi:hypothetical protein
MCVDPRGAPAFARYTTQELGTCNLLNRDRRPNVCLSPRLYRFVTVTVLPEQSCSEYTKEATSRLLESVQSNSFGKTIAEWDSMSPKHTTSE